MRKYFTWTYIKSPSGHRAILIIVILLLITWYIFRKVPLEKDNQQKILQLQSENEVLQKSRSEDSIFRTIVVSKIETLQASVNNKENSKQIIYERIRNDVYHYDTASTNELQRFFTDRYGKE